MATTTGTRFPTGQLPDCGPKSPCAPAPVCPACGGLECLCRPRFFAGQLLTEGDLNRLDDYIVAKNRLHNRYLVGWGVACGLEVVCSVCDPKGSKATVIVKSGYALSPCGNDIIVCGDTAVNVCDLIARCRPADDMCLRPESAAGAVDDPCGGGTEEWVLGICYTEKPSRGVTALLNASDPSACSCGCHSGCGCGGATAGKSSCGCGCGGAGKKAKPSSRSGTPQPECEPTMTCESYRFAVWKAPKPDKPTRTWGAAATRFICCVEPFLNALGQYPANASADELTQWYFDLRETVRGFLVHEGLYDCEIAAKLAAATTPTVANGTDLQVKSSVLQATYAVLAIGTLVVQKCLCAALLPPCPALANTDCVPIATVTVKRRPCEVLRICNISARKFLVTIPNIQYWLSFFSVFQSNGAGGFSSLRALLEKLCCTDLEKWFRDYTKGANLFEPHAAQPQPEAIIAPHTAAAGTTSPFASILWQALVTPGREVNPATFMLAAMGAHDRQGQPLASDAELANPTEFLLAHQVVAPVLRAMLPSDVMKAAGAGRRAAADAEPAADARVENLSRQVADLAKTVKRQQRVIDNLKKSRPR